MKITINKRLLVLVMLITFKIGISQVGINTDAPKATLDVVGDDNAPLGVIVPRISGDDLQAKNSLYGADQNGMIIYVTFPVGSPGASGDKTIDVTKAGYYYFDAYSGSGGLWYPMGAGSEPWQDFATGKGASLNSQNIYQMGQVAVGASSLTSTAQFEVSSADKGVLISRMSKDARDAIANPADGLIIYNTTSSCLNYYSAPTHKWLGLCGSYEPAKFTMSCTGITVSGTYTQGASLTSAENIKVKIHVTEPGSYDIFASSGNGYSFYKSGNYIEIGDYEITLEGQGSPTNVKTPDVVEFTINGTKNTCIANNTILPASVTYSANCGGITAPAGTYMDFVPLDGPGGTQYIDIPITVTAGGNASITTDTKNGFYFASGTVPVTPATTSIRLYANGTPTATGPVTFTFSTQGASPTTCTFNVTVTSSTGFSWRNPANSCLQILQTTPTASDGLYFIKNGSTAVKTFCDMTNGGWTLVWSRSEKRDADNRTYTYGLSVSNQPLNRNLPLGINAAQATSDATAASSTVTWREYRLPLAVMQNINTTSNTGDFKVRIVQDATNVFKGSDSWANNNYQIIHTKGHGSTKNFLSTGATSYFGFDFEGKLFGATFNATRTTTTSGDSNIRVEINGAVAASSSAYGWWMGYTDPTNDVLDFDTTLSGPTITYTTPNGNVTIQANQINDLWESYSVGLELNHHWGKCGVTNTSGAATGDDYVGLATCYYYSMQPHSFNGGEGRILQWFIK